MPWDILLKRISNNDALAIFMDDFVNIFALNTEHSINFLPISAVFIPFFTFILHFLHSCR